jgi:hypothetical protein
MQPRLIPIFVMFVSLSCASTKSHVTRSCAPAAQPMTEVALTNDVWVGVYASTSEIGGFSGTVLLLEQKDGNVEYRMRRHSDVSSNLDIPQDELRGTCLTVGNTLFLPEAYGFFNDGKPILLSNVTRYTHIEINGHRVLMRDDALRAFRTDHKLYDYGILVKVNDKPDRVDIQKVAHPSIKMLQSNPNVPWQDPFVPGPNNR